MNTIIPAMAAFLMSACLIQLLRLPARRWGLVDLPGGRKHHEGAIPLVGGLAILGGLLIGIPAIEAPAVTGLLLSISVLLAVGIWDDRRDLSPHFRLASQIGAALLLVFLQGSVIDDLGRVMGTRLFALHDLAIPFTLLCIVGFINAFNMVDGVDGLAGGLAFFALLWMGVAASLAHGSLPPLFPVAIAALIGFLVFNMRYPGRRRASVFLGDSGSMLLGALLAWFAIELSQGPQRALSPIAIAWILALPVLDTISLMVRRLCKGQSPFRPDREHMHHILQRAGFTAGETAWFLIGVSGVLGGIAVAAHRLGVPEWVLTIGFLGLFGFHLYFVLHAWRMMKLIKRFGLWRRLRFGVPGRKRAIA